jgi:hypothetical protein
MSRTLVTEIKQCVQRKKKKNKAWPPIMPKQHEWCLHSNFDAFIEKNLVIKDTKKR